MSSLKKIDGHRDLSKYQTTLQKAKSDGRIDPNEKAALKKAFAQLEPGEKKLVAPKPHR